MIEPPPTRPYAAAWEAFYEAHHARAYAYAYRLSDQNAHDAEDLTQDAFWKAFKAWEQTPAPSRQWLYTIVLHLAMDRARHRKVVKFLSFDWWFTFLTNDEQWETRINSGTLMEVDPNTDTEGDVLTAETQAEVRTVLASLSIQDRACLTLQADEHLTYDEIASVLGTTRAGVKTRMWRARNRFFVEANRLGYWPTWTHQTRPLEVYA